MVDAPASPPTSPAPTALVARPAAASGGGTAAPTCTPKTSALSNSRKGYKLTLVISATTEAGFADAQVTVLADTTWEAVLLRTQSDTARAVQQLIDVLQPAAAQ
jgi:hypothetical protein